MSTRSKPEDFDEYAPKWLREGQARPLHPSPRLPSAPSLVMSDHEPAFEPSDPAADNAGYEPAFDPLRRRDDGAFEGDVAIRQWRRQRSLEPELVAEPHWSEPKPLPVGTLVRTTIALGVATFGALAYVGVVPLPYSQVFHNAISVLREPLPAGPDAVPPSPREQPEATAANRIADSYRPQNTVSPDAAMRASEPPAVSEASDAPRAVKPVAVTVVSPQSPWPAAAPAPAAAPVVRRLDPEEVEHLIRRGEAFISQGDFAAARPMLRRAADAGSARAAEMVAETYDARMLRKVGAVGVQPDAAQAREWYEKAVALGAPEMSARLEGLPR